MIANIVLPILNDKQEQAFSLRLAECSAADFRSHRISTLQVNLGKKCNQACQHCHVDAGPQRTEQMSADTVELVLDVLRQHHIPTLDITGGAPEINPHFRYLASEGCKYCARVIDRSNLTIFFEQGFEDLPEFLAAQRIEVTASLPCYNMDNVDTQRGAGVFDKSIRALQRLNALGYGRDRDLVLNLVYNPIGAHLPPSQATLEQQYKQQLRERFGIEFNDLMTITNMPISRFAHDLQRRGQMVPYMQLLQSSFNPHTLDGLMCRQLISVGYDGRLYDCDFNQMLDMPVDHGLPNHIRDFDLHLLAHRQIRTASHCFGCTAGCGSSCSGAVTS